MNIHAVAVEWDDVCEVEQPGTQAKQISHAVCAFQQQATGHSPRAVSVVLSQDTVVVTLHEALTPAELAVFQSENGAARLRLFHQQLFANSSRSLRQEIKRITGRQVHDATAEVETATGAIVHVFATGDMVQVFMLGLNASAKT